MQEHGSKKVVLSEKVKKILLVGNPNVGKSVIFGVLTGKYVTVSNYPGTTVEISRGNATLNNEKYLVLDTPGVNSLIPMSEDEMVTRDILLGDQPQAVIQVADSKNLKRGLLLSLQLAEMDVPFSLALNMDDEARSRGIRINAPKLEEALGVDVVSTVAVRRQGIDTLTQKLPQQRKSKKYPTYDPPIEESIEKVSVFLPDATISKRSLSLMILAGDESLKRWLHEHIEDEKIKEIEAIRRSLEERYDKSLSSLISEQRLKAVERILSNGILHIEEVKKKTIRRRLGDWSMHPVWGLPFLLMVLYLVYWFVGVFGAGACVDFLESVVFEGYLNPGVIWLVETLVPFPFIKDLLVGDYGIFTMALTYAIAIVLPIVGTFFIAFGILEDSGYLPRLAVMVNKIFKVMGLNGKAILPMVLGLGCDTMATMTARILETRKERIIVTLLLALGIPCSAQLGVIMGMLASLSLMATIWWAGVLCGVIFLVGYLAAKVIPGQGSDFVLELPPIRFPQLTNIAVKTLARMEWYLKEAVPLFILGTLILFCLDKLGALSIIERTLSPVIVGFLGLPAQAAEAFLIGFLRRDYGAAGLFALWQDGLLDPIQVVVSLVTITLFIPCIANIFIIIKERGFKTALAMSAFIFPFALLVGGSLNFVLRSLDVRF